MRYVHLVIVSMYVQTVVTTVCDYNYNVTVPLPPPGLAPVFSASIEWKSSDTNSTTTVREVHNSITHIDSQQILIEGQTFKAILDYEEKQYVTYSPENGCAVKSYGNLVFFQDKMWLSPLYMIHSLITRAKPKNKGSTTIRSTEAAWYQSCLYFYEQNTTVLIDLYFSRLGWLMPHVSPDMFVPLRIAMKGEKTINGTTTTFDVVGDIIDYVPGPKTDFSFMELPTGVFCEGKKSRKPLNPFPQQFSLTMESIDMDRRTIVYENIWFDPSNNLVRRDSKDVTGTDADAIKEVFDFNLGIHYLIDPYMGKCQPVSMLRFGDRFVARGVNDTIRMQSPFEFFHVTNAQTQYVGYRSTRGIDCEVWVGVYEDTSANFNVTVEWYFAKAGWNEAVGGVVQPDPLVRMNVWLGGSKNPIVKNILQLDIEPPSIDAFDVTECYSAKHRARILVQYTVQKNQSLELVSLSYLKDLIQKQLTAASQIPLLRITKGYVYVSGSDVYFDGLLLDEAPFENPNDSNRPASQYPLFAVLLFLHGFVSGNSNLTVSTTNGMLVVLTTRAIRQINYDSEFTTTPATTTQSTTIATPPQPIHTPSTYKQVTPTEETPPLPPLTTKGPHTPCSCPNVTCPPPTSTQGCTKTCPACTGSAAVTQSQSTTCKCPTVDQTTRCPVVTPCPSSSCPPCRTTPCPAKVTCPPVTSCPPGITTGPKSTTCKCPTVDQTTKCPVVTPCPSSSCPPCRTTPCPAKVTCPPVTSCPTGKNTALGNQHQTSNNNGGVSGGGAAGLAIAMVIIGILIGVVIPQIYKKYKGLRNPDTRTILANHLDDEAKY